MEHLIKAFLQKIKEFNFEKQADFVIINKLNVLLYIIAFIILICILLHLEAKRRKNIFYRYCNLRKTMRYKDVKKFFKGLKIYKKTRYTLEYRVMFTRKDGAHLTLFFDNKRRLSDYEIYEINKRQFIKGI